MDKADVDVAQPGQALVTYWRSELQNEDKEHKEFREFAETAEAEYRAEKNKCERFNIFWSNVQVQMGALYQESGSPEVRRRQKSDMGPAKDAAMMLERAIDFCVDSQDFEGNMKQAEKDWLTVGLGQSRVKYKPVIETFTREVIGFDDMGAQIVVEEQYEQITAQMVEVEFFSWRHFHWQPCKAWEFCGWVAFDHYWTKEQVRKAYGVKASETDLDDEGNKRVKVTEIYDKKTRTTVVISDQFDVPLEIRSDELGLAGFFPCPKPLVVNLKSASFEPKADYWFYKDQARQVNKSVTRRDLLVDSLKDNGFYDSHFEELSSLTNKSDGDYVPVQDLLDKLNGAGLESVIFKMPIEQTAKVITALNASIDVSKQEIYEILGIADIVRGASVASESATAQGLKSQYASVRMRDKTQCMAYFVRDIFALMGEIIAEHFEPDILETMTGVEATPEIMSLLRDDVMRRFSIDVESDSTLAQDEREEQSQRLEALNTVSSYIQGLLPAIQDGAVPLEIGKEMLLMAVRGFKYAGNLEDQISQMGTDDPQAAVQQMEMQMREMAMEMDSMRAALAEVDQLEQYETEADIRKKNAETDKLKAETQEQQIENAANIQTLSVGRGAPYATG